MALFHTFKTAKAIAVMMLTVSPLLVSFSATPAEAAGIHTAMTRVTFSQPNCVPDFDDNWYAKVAERVNTRLSSNGINGESESATWKEFVEGNNLLGKVLNRAEVDNRFKNHVRERYDIVVDVDVSKYVTYRHGLTSVAVSMTVKSPDGAVLAKVGGSKSNVPGTSRETVLAEMIDSLMNRVTF